MEIKDVMKLLEEMKVGVFATVDSDGNPHARHAHITAANEAVMAIRNDNQAASKIWLLLSKRPYHWVEKPPHTVTKRDSLKEYTTNTTKGIYKKANPKHNMILRNQDSFCLPTFVSFDFAVFIMVE